MNYDSEILKLIPNDKIYRINMQYIDMELPFILAKFNVDTMKCSKINMYYIVKGIYPFVLTNMLKTEVIDNENDIYDKLRCYFFYESEELKFVIIM